MESINYPYRINIENTKVRKFWEELENNKIMTTKCKDCNTMHWPPRSFCNNCYSSNIDWTELPNTGTLLTFTNVTAPAVGFPEEGYYLAIVRLAASKLQVFGQIQKNNSEIKQGAKVHLQIEEDNNKYKYFKIVLDN